MIEYVTNAKSCAMIKSEKVPCDLKTAVANYKNAHFWTQV